MPNSYSLGAHFEDLIQRQVRSGRFASASEVVREGLRLMEEREAEREARTRWAEGGDRARARERTGHPCRGGVRRTADPNQKDRRLTSKKLRQVEFAPQARADLIDIFDYIAGDDNVRAEAFVGRIEQRCNALLDFPELGRSRSELAPDLRSIPHGAYLIFYTPDAEVVRIERILHGARDIEEEFSGDE